MNSPVANVLRHLDNVQETTDGWMACCPAHDDSTPSLSVGEGHDGRVLLHCFKGCETKAVVQAAGLTMANLYPESSRGDGSVRPAQPPPLPSTPNGSEAAPKATEPDSRGIARKEIERYEAALLESDGDAAKAARRYLCERRGIEPALLEAQHIGLRFKRGRPWIVISTAVGEDRVVRWKEYAFDPASCDWARDGNGHKIVRNRGGSAVLYAVRSLSNSGPLLLCEGEIDALSAVQMGFHAASGTAGASTFKQAWAKEIAGARIAREGVVVCYDGDEAGRSGAQHAAQLLAEAGADVRIANLPDGSDVNDILLRGGREALGSTIQAAAPFREQDEEARADSFFQNPRPNVKERTLLFETAAEITQRGLPETRWLVDGLLPEGALILLSGIAKGGGKTTFAAHVARALLSGTPFLSRDAMRTPVVYLTEQAQASFHNEYLNPIGLDTSEDLHLLHGFKSAGITWAHLVERAVERCQEVEAQLLIIDTFMHFAGLFGEQENSSGAVQQALKPLQHAAAEHGLTIVVIHHDRKGGGDVFNSSRGSSAFQGAVDLILNLQRPAGNHRPTIREMRTAGRFADVPEELMIELDGDTYKALGTGHDVAMQEARQAVLKAAPALEEDALRITDKDGPDLLSAAQRINPNVKESTLRAALKALRQNGRVRRIGRGVKGDPHRHYRPPDEQAGDV